MTLFDVFEISCIWGKKSSENDQFTGQLFLKKKKLDFFFYIPEINYSTRVCKSTNKKILALTMSNRAGSNEMLYFAASHQDLP